MLDLSLGILDIAMNSVVAGAKNIGLTIDINNTTDTLSLIITDDGRGMSPEVAAKAADPFYTTRKTREVGLGLPFHKMQAELTGGTFAIDSEPGRGTVISTTYTLSHIDRLPLGSIEETVVTLIQGSPDIEFKLRFSKEDEEFMFDTAEIKAQLDGMPIDSPEILNFLKEFLRENINNIRGEVI